ncbi:carboxypeptidase-like regulatory domain-containing protein [Flavobacterium sp.]|uniref:carboxypeptidase-like regulatory domain-containing protein n=1 Tax=Flavobacterium sp. TaxID=239 RepID=UPI003752B772
MIKFKILAALLFSALLFLSCNPNDDVSHNNSNTEFSKNFGEGVARDFIGQVVDEQNNPIKNATVTIGNSIVKTDENGVFLINDAFVFKKFAHIKVAKSGYIDGSRSMVPTLGKNRVTIMLTSYNSIQYIESGVRSEVLMSNGTKIVFDGAFQDEYGRSYKGIVNVSAFHLTPSDDNLSSLMPGMLYAEDKNGQEKVLETYGMLNVELYGNNGGQKLQIATGHTAEISLQIDDTQLASAPNTIPLWHFDEKNGYWKEEGVATRQGNLYVGKVSHFSWWNCDDPFSSVSLSLTILDINGNPLAGMGVGLVRNDNISATSYTDEHGNISGLIPSNEAIVMNVYDDCGTIIYTTVIGPFSSDTTLPNVVVTNFQPIIITGNVLKCNNANVTNGYVYFKTPNRSVFQSVINGGFTINASNCTSINSFSLQGFDFDSHQQTENANYTFTGNNINVGNLQTCTAMYNYITCKIDNNATITYIETNGFSVIASGGNGGGRFKLEAIKVYDAPNIRIEAPTTNLGTFNSPPYVISGIDLPTRFINTQMPNTLSFHLINYGNVGEFVDLTANGSFYDTLGIQHTIQLTAHVKR